MTQIIKRCFSPLFITLLLLATLVISPTNVWAQGNSWQIQPDKWHIQFNSKADRELYMGGITLRGNFASQAEAEAYQKSRPKFEYDNSWIVGPDRTTTGSSKTSISTQNPEMQLVQTLIESLFDAAFKKPGNSQQQMSDPNEQAEAQHKKEALQRWLDFQATEAMKKEAEKTKQGEDLLSQMETVGNGDELQLQPFSMGNPKLDMQPISQTSYPTSKYTEWKRLLCSAYFSDLAKKSTNDVDARFYADQAERVMAGEPTYIECRIPKVSDEKAKRMEEVKILYNEMNVKFKDLQYIESKLQETRDTIKKAELKKDAVNTRINEIRNRTANVEEKSNVDSLLIQAQKELADADNEIRLAKNAEGEFLSKKSNSENDLNDLKTRIQGKIQAGEEK